VATQRKRPKGDRYQGLYKRGSVVYFERERKGSKRIRISTGTADWVEAAAFRDEWLRLHVRRAGMELPTFATFAERYLKEDTGALAATTAQDRRRHLTEDGPILPLLGNRRLDAVTPALLREWWGSAVEGRGRKTKTGREYVNTIAAVFHYARDLGLVDSSPVPALREMIRRKAKTQRGRAEADAGRDVRPIEDLAALKRLVRQARVQGPQPLVYVLLGLDAGLRQGEALGLRWGQIVWGGDNDDQGRHLRIIESRPRGGVSGPPKSGRARSVALSRRLRRALVELYVERGSPLEDEHVLHIHPSNFNRRDWASICKRARVGHVRYKDLRDTFASWLITCGVPLGYVSRQLGHSDLAVTARHYVKWAAGDEYRDTMARETGELPADLLARLDSPHIPPSVSALLTGVREEPEQDRSLGGGPSGTRTLDPRVKSPVLCQLS